jgi:hypothetical protein
MSVLFTAACGPSASGPDGGGGGSGDGGGPGDGGSSADAFPLPDAEACAATAVQAEEATAPVDIIWVVDTSGSMDFESATVESNLNSFAAQIGSWGLDYRVVMVAQKGSGDDVCVPPPLGGPGCTDGAQFRHVDLGVGSDAALQKLIEAYPSYQDVLRASSIKHFVAVSDDEADGSSDDSWFKTQIAGLTAPGFPALPAAPQGYIFHSIVAWGDIPFIGCITGAAVGQSYLDLTALTSGVKAKVCDTNWDPIFDALQTAVLANTQLPCAFAIPEPPAGETLDPDRVNFVYTPSGGSPVTFPRVDSATDCGTSHGWYYDDPLAPTQIFVCPATCTVLETDADGRVDIQFGCASIVL